MNKEKKLLEICAFSLEAAINAEKSGADRIELCANASEGGTTPDFALIKITCEKLTIPVFSIIRPRGGNFSYNNDEFEMMKTSVLISKQLGCKGIAFSILKQNNKIDIDRTAELVNLAFPMESTFIRGFDLTPDPFEAMEAVKKAGCKRILTSGLTQKAADAIPLLKQLVEKSNNEVIIMPCSGINSRNLKQLLDETGANEFHASARIIVENNDELINKFGFGNIIDCDSNEVERMKKILNPQRCCV